MSVVYTPDYDRILAPALLVNGERVFRKMTTNELELQIARVVKQTPHPNIARVLKVTECYYDTELLEEFTDVDNICVDDLRAVKDFFQSLGIFYIDWHEENIVVDKNGVQKLIDFDASFTSNDEPGKSPYIYNRAIKEGLSDLKEIDDYCFEAFLRGET